MFEKAAKKISVTIEIEPNNKMSFDFWSVMLLTQAGKQSGKKRAALDNLALEKANSAELINPGTTAYNFACVAALRNDEVTCQAELERSRNQERFPGKTHIKNDPDFKPFRKKKWFKDFLASLDDDS